MQRLKLGAKAPAIVFFKVFACVCLGLLFHPFISAQADEDGLNHSLAYLDRAIDCYNAGDFDEAMRSVNTALLYSSIPAEIFHIKALLLSEADFPRGDVLESAYAAFDEGRRWFHFEPNSAAELAASLLADTGRFSEALSLLERYSPQVTADSALIRCKALYVQGNFAAARDAIYSASRRWPTDERFPLLFFQFEEFYRLDAIAANAASVARPANIRGTERVFEIGSWIVSAWNPAGNPEAPLELSLASIPFVRLDSPEDAARIASRIWNMGGLNLLSPQAAAFAAAEALREGIASADEALDAFFSLAESAEGVPITALEYLCAIAQASSDVQLQGGIAQRLSAFGGVLSADSNKDFIPDSRVSYRAGRPHSAVYDLNQDGYPDMVAECGFGEPVSIFFPIRGASIDYQTYPTVSSVRLEGVAYEMRSASFDCAPLIAENLRFDFLSPGFFFLSADAGFVFPRDENLIAFSASRLESNVLVSETGNQAEVMRETIYDENGLPFSAREIRGGAVISKTTFRNGKPAESIMDSDGDGHFEKRVVYGGAGGYDAIVSGYTIEESIFVDTDGDRIFNYAEFTLSNGSVRQAWLDAEGVSSHIQWTKMPDGSSSASWRHPESGLEVIANFSAPASTVRENFSVYYQGKTRRAFYDAAAGIWWLDRNSPLASANLTFAATNLKQNEYPVAFTDVEFEVGFIRILKVGDYLFAETVSRSLPR